MACRQQRVKEVASILKNRSASHAVEWLLLLARCCRQSMGTFGVDRAKLRASKKQELAEGQLQGPAPTFRLGNLFGSQLYLVPCTVMQRY
jgi:hypothetical protein